MKPEPGSSCHTQANDKLKRTGVFSRANVEESFPGTVSGPKKTSAKIHRRNSASTCVRAAAGALGEPGGEGGTAGNRPLHPAEMVGGHRRASAPGLRRTLFLPHFQNAPQLPKQIKLEGLERGRSPEMAPGIPLFPPLEVKGDSCSLKARRELQGVPPQDTLFGVSGSAGHLPSDVDVFFHHSEF